MGTYKNTNGVLSPIAGRGKAEYGASTVRTGTATWDGTTVSAYPTVNVVFDSPMPDADYEIFFDYDGASGHGEKTYYGQFAVNGRTANGFTISMSSTIASGISAGWNVKYVAFKLYTDTEYNGLLTDVTGLKDTVRKKLNGTIYNPTLSKPTIQANTWALLGSQEITITYRPNRVLFDFIIDYSSGAPTGAAITMSNSTTPTSNNSIAFSDTRGGQQLSAEYVTKSTNYVNAKLTFYFWGKWEAANATQSTATRIIVI